MAEYAPLVFIVNHRALLLLLCGAFSITLRWDVFSRRALLLARIGQIQSIFFNLYVVNYCKDRKMAKNFSIRFNLLYLHTKGAARVVKHPVLLF